MPNRNSSSDNTHSFNLRFFIITTVIFVVIGVTAYVVHRIQIDRVTDASLRRAEEFAEKEEWLKASEYLIRYVQLRPNDKEARIKLARYYDNGHEGFAQIDQRIRYFSQAIGFAEGEEKKELQLRLADLHLSKGSTQDYESLLLLTAEQLWGDLPQRDHTFEELEKLGEPDAEFVRYRALAMVGLFEEKESVTVGAAEGADQVGPWLIAAIAANPLDADLSFTLGRVYRERPHWFSREYASVQGWESQADRDLEADQVMADLVQNLEADNADDSLMGKGHFARFQYESLYQLGNQLEHLEKALSFSPKDADILLGAGQYWLAEGTRRTADEAEIREQELEQADQFFVQIIDEIDETDADAWYGRAEVAIQRSETDAAIGYFEQGLAYDPFDNPTVITRLCEALIFNEEYERASELLTEVEDRVERILSSQQFQQEVFRRLDASILYLRGRVALTNGEYADAVGPFENMIAERGDLDEALTMRARRDLAITYIGLLQWDNSTELFLEAYEEARTDEDRHDLLVRAALSAIQGGNHILAIECLERAVQLPQARAIDWFHLASSYFQYQVRSPEQRDFAAFEDAVNQTANRLDDGSLAEPWRLEILRAKRNRYEYTLLTDIDVRIEKRNEILESNLRQLESRLTPSDFSVLSDGEKQSWISLMRELVVMYESLDAFEDSDRAIAKLDEVDTLMALARVKSFVYQRRGDFASAEQAIDDALAGIDSDSPQDVLQLRLGRVQILISQRLGKEAIEELIAIHRQFPDQTNSIAAHIFDTAYNLNLPVANEEARQIIRDAEGPRGARNLYLLGRDYLDATIGQPDDIATEYYSLATQVINTLHVDRPDWPPTSFLAGYALHQQKKYDDAVDHYATAIENGDQRPVVVMQIVDALVHLDRFDDVERYLAIFASETPESDALSSIAVGIKTRQGKLDGALELARSGVQERPNAPEPCILLGQVLVLRGEVQQAEVQFLTAVERASLQKKFRAMSALYTFYLATRQNDSARQVLIDIESAMANGEAMAAPLDLALALGRGYELLQDREMAIQYYDDAYRLAPKQTALLLRLAVFYAAFDSHQAERYLLEILAINSSSASARRMLASLLANRGDDNSWQRALNLLDPNDPQQDIAKFDSRLLSMLYLKRAITDLANETEHLNSASDLIQVRMANSQVPALADLLLYATIQLKHAESAPTTKLHAYYLALAEATYEQICTGPTPFADHIANYFRLLLQCHAVQQELASIPPEEGDDEEVKEFREREFLIDANAELLRLKRVTDNNLLSLTLEIELNRRRGREEALPELVEDAVADKLRGALTEAHRVDAYLIGAELFRLIDNGDRAIELAEQAIAIDETKYATYVLALADGDRIGEAIDICIAKYDEAATEQVKSVILLSAITVSSGPEGDDLDRVSAMMDRALADYPDNARIISAVGGVRVIQARTDEAIALYRLAREKDPNDPIVLNNLATLLLEDHEHASEAIDAINEAIEIYGDESALLDTLGMSLWSGRESLTGPEADGYLQLAVKALRQATRKANADARSFFHLAVVLRDSGDRERAYQALQNALNMNLEDAVLTDFDLQLLQDLQESFVDFEPNNP